MDGLLGRYHVRVKTNNVMMRLFYHLLDVATINAYILYHRIEAQKKLDPDYVQLQKENLYELPEFRSVLADGLASFGEKRVVGRPKRGDGTHSPTPPPSPLPPVGRRGSQHPIADVRFDGFDHMPMWMGKDELKKKCKQCKQSQTKCYCSKCNIHLCCTTEKNCFLQYHTKP